MKPRHFVASVIAGATLVALVSVTRAQQPAPGGRGAAVAGQPQAGGRGQPTAPPGINWPSPPLPEAPVLIDTGIVHQIRIVPLKGFNQPWSMAFLPDGNILVAERPGCLRIVHDGALEPQHVV